MTVNDLKEILVIAEKELIEVNNALKQNPQDIMSNEIKLLIEDEVNDIKRKISSLRNKIINDILNH